MSKKKTVAKKAPVKKTPVKKTIDKKPPVDETVNNGQNEQDTKDALTEPAQTSASTQTQPETKTNETPASDAQAQAGSPTTDASNKKDDVAKATGDNGLVGMGVSLLVRVKHPLTRRFRAGIEFTREWLAVEVDENGAAWHALHDDHMLEVQVGLDVGEAQN